MLLDERLVTVSDMTSTIRSDSELSQGGAPTVRPVNMAPFINPQILNEPRLPTDHITTQMIAKTLTYLPFYNVLTPAIRHYIAERVSVESYLPMERIEVQDPLKALDFLYVAKGGIEFLLENIVRQTGGSRYHHNESVTGRKSLASPSQSVTQRST